MIIAKNLWRLRKSHTSGGRSRSSQLMRHSSSMRQSSSTGPSRNACSSSDSVAGGTARSLAQSGLPLNRSASHHTSPASIASRSVSESVGSTCCAQRKIGLEIKSRRSEVALIEASARVVDSKVLYGCGVGHGSFTSKTHYDDDGDTWDDDWDDDGWCHIGVTYGVTRFG